MVAARVLFLSLGLACVQAVKLADGSDDGGEIVQGILMESSLAPPGEWSERGAEVKRLRAMAQTTDCDTEASAGVPVDHTDGCQAECAACDEPNWVNDYCMCKAGPSCSQCRQSWCDERYAGKNFNLEQCAKADQLSASHRKELGIQKSDPPKAGAGDDNCTIITHNVDKLTDADKAKCTTTCKTLQKKACIESHCCKWEGKTGAMEKCEESMGDTFQFLCFPLTALQSSDFGASDGLFGKAKKTADQIGSRDIEDDMGLIGYRR